MDATEYRARRARRGDLAMRALRDASARDELMRPWRFAESPDLLANATAALALPESAQAERLAAWAVGPAPHLVHSEPRTELEFDRQVLDTVPQLATDGETRKAAAWYLLSRLGEEIRRRDLEPAKLQRHAHDAAARTLWEQLFDHKVGLATARQLRTLYGSSIKRAFAAVGTELRLSSSFIESKMDGALEAMDFLAYGDAWIDVAVRLVEGAGDPVPTLASALDERAASVVATCVGGRDAWSRTGAMLLGRTLDPATLADHLSVGVDLHVFLRLVEHLAEGVPSATSVGLPGWLIVTQNKGKIRGRLRAVLAAEPTRLKSAVLRMDCLYARSEAAMSRYAWDWAWREARLDYSFNLDTLRPSACRLPDPGTGGTISDEPLDARAVLTTLLLLVGRGVWTDLERWVQDQPASTLTDRFYRYLALAPDCVADLGGRNRRYVRLFEHLETSLDDYRPAIVRVAQRVALVRRADRGMKEDLQRALQPDWDASFVVLPESRSIEVQENFLAFIARHGAPGGSGGES